MAGIAEFLAPLAFLGSALMALPAGTDPARYGADAISVDEGEPDGASPADSAPAIIGTDRTAHAPLPVNALDLFHEHGSAAQIRIQQRVIVRIAPRGGRTGQSLLAQLPQRAPDTRYEERKAGDCVAVQRIAGVETGSGNRLILFMRDAKIMSLNLEKACRARDFYAGFYVERNEDGKLCIDRDRLQSRSGAKCQIDRMMQLVAVND
jgi:hypothetical protein